MERWEKFYGEFRAFVFQNFQEILFYLVLIVALTIIVLALKRVFDRMKESAEDFFYHKREYKSTMKDVIRVKTYLETKKMSDVTAKEIYEFIESVRKKKMIERTRKNEELLKALYDNNVRISKNLKFTDLYEYDRDYDKVQKRKILDTRDIDKRMSLVYDNYDERDYF